MNEVDGGYYIIDHKEFVSHADPRIKFSKDQDFHVCKVKTADRIRCLYIPRPAT